MNLLVLTGLERLRIVIPAFLLVAFALAGCAVLPPVQEMSDARQAIDAAREARAGTYAPDTLQQAERYLQIATQDLERGAFEQARSAAMAAKTEAVKARDQALAQAR